MKKLLAFILTLVTVMSTVTLLPLSVSADDVDTTPKLLTYSENYAGKPAGSGTKDNPYKIATADDLLWMARQHANGNDTTNVGTGTIDATLNPFADAYFEQTDDIDLGYAVVPSIGYEVICPAAFKWFERYEATDGKNSSKYAMFGGTYDGKGYSIKNGYVGSVMPNATELASRDVDTFYFGTGLFGVIYGATIKNVNLKNVSLYRSQNADVTVAGLLVGIAVGDYTGATTDFNQIINCTIDANCSLDVTGITGRSTSYSSFDATSTYRYGGIVGSANSCTITNCTNKAAITVDEFAGAVGGITAAMSDVVMTNCANYGNINVTCADEATHVEGGTYLPWRAIGGIAGMLDRCDSGTAAKIFNDAYLKNCYNAGNIIITTDENNASVVNSYALGGIVGMTRRMRVGNVLEMTYCYNTGAFTTPADMANGAYRAEGAIIGIVSVSTEKSDGTGIGYVKLENVVSASVVTKTSAGDIPDTKLSSSGNALNTVKDGDVALYSSYNTQVKGVTGIATVADVITAANCSIATDSAKLAKEADMVAACDLGLQAHNTDAGKYRFVATIDGLEWDEAGFNITLNDGTEKVIRNNLSVPKAYNSIEANGVTVTDINGRKYIVIVLTGMEKGWTFEVSAYVKDATGTYTTTTRTGAFY